MFLWRCPLVVCSYCMFQRSYCCISIYFHEIVLASIKNIKLPFNALVHCMNNKCWTENTSKRNTRDILFCLHMFPLFHFNIILIRKPCSSHGLCTNPSTHGSIILVASRGVRTHNKKCNGVLSARLNSRPNVKNSFSTVIPVSFSESTGVHLNVQCLAQSNPFNGTVMTKQQTYFRIDIERIVYLVPINSVAVPTYKRRWIAYERIRDKPLLFKCLCRRIVERVKLVLPASCNRKRCHI